jgi:PadR family transcriptional regulator, regulatory protein PadR
MAPNPPDLLQGTLDLLILKALAAGPLHGWAIAKRIQQLSREVLTATQGSLYPALYRLEDRGWVAGADALSAEGRRIKIYRLTPSGRKQLAGQTESWRAFAAAMNHVLGAN